MAALEGVASAPSWFFGGMGVTMAVFLTPRAGVDVPFASRNMALIDARGFDDLAATVLLSPNGLTVFDKIGSFSSPERPVARMFPVFLAGVFAVLATVFTPDAFNDDEPALFIPVVLPLDF